MIIIKYETLVQNPKIISKKMCSFLKIKYSDDMIDTSKFTGLGKNTKKWKPNSNFKSPQRGIYKNSLYKWKNFLSRKKFFFKEKIF